MLGASILLIIIGFLLVLYAFISYIFSLLLPYQIYEMIISTILMIFLLYIYSYIFELSMTPNIIIALLYLNWYYFTKLISNTVNKDDTGVIRFD